MQHVKTHKILPVVVRPGDSINLKYAYEEPKDVWKEKILKVDDFTEEQIIDTVIVYRVNNEYGLKAGRALILGEDDGTYKDVKPETGRAVIGNRTTSLATK